MYQLRESDKKRIYDYIKKEPEMNLFIYGDIENYGVAAEPVSLYAFPDEHLWDCVLLKYFDFFIVYSRNEIFDAQAVADFLQDKTIDCISGKTSLIQQMQPYFPELTVRSTYISRCNRVKHSSGRAKHAKPELRRLGKDEAENVCRLLSQIEEFSDTYQAENALEKNTHQLTMNLAHGSLLYGAYSDGKLVATAATSAANSQSAMVVGVATLPEYRNRGYASAAVAALCRASFNEGKKFLCLFYDNPCAGSIYRRIGFKEIGEYAMLR